jgi:hypothetical protein
MIDFHCACGAAIRMPDSAAGRRATCTTCGQKVTIPSPALQSVGVGEPDFALEPEAAVVGLASVAMPPLPPAPQPSRSQYTTSSREAFEAAREARRQRGFFGDAALAFINVMTFRSLISVVSLALMLAGSGMFLASSVGRSGRRGGYGLMLVLMSIGAVFLYAYQVIICTANGDDEMPAFWDIEDLRAEIFSAAGSLAATVGVLLIPSFVTLIAMLMSSAQEDTIVKALAISSGVSLLVFPVTILAVALGGVSVLGRFDLILRTVIAAPFAYLAVLMTMTVAGLISAGLVYLIVTGPSASAIAVFGGTGAMLAYFSVVCARQIGLFYRHFSDRFPWTAG